MKNATCRISADVRTFKEAEEKVKKDIKDFLQLDDEGFEAVYKNLEITMRIEKVSAEHSNYFADATFTIPQF
jgi:hypothetical protein